MSRWNERDDVQRGEDYDARWRKLAAEGGSIHGEADLIASFGPGSVLDAGCGTGRVAIELARRGIDVVGVDLDDRMLDSARDKAPGIDWRTGDLVDVTVSSPSDTGSMDGPARQFDVVAMPGNVMVFVAPGTEREVLSNMARHLSPRGHLIAGFRVSSDELSVEDFDAAATAAGLVLDSRWSTWDRQPFDGGDYAVSVHRWAR